MHLSSNLSKGVGAHTHTQECYDFSDENVCCFVTPMHQQQTSHESNGKCRVSRTLLKSPLFGMLRIELHDLLISIGQTT